MISKSLHLNRKSEVVSWLNRKIFPLYIVHQTVILAALFYVLPLHLGVAAKYMLVLSLTLGVSLVFCVLAERLPWPLRALFGLPEQPVGVPGLAKAPTQPVRF